MKILVTGAAGFIGFHLVKKLIFLGHEVIGIDNINDYYDPLLKIDRLKELGILTDKLVQDEINYSTLYSNNRFIKTDISRCKQLTKIFAEHKFDVVCHFAAQAGVRYSISNPHQYAISNLTGFLNILECCREFSIKHLVYASSSSVYGKNGNSPYSVHNPADHPISLYAASKKSNEMMAHSYSYLYGLPTTGLRLFTVYGPFGRPDMAYFKFTEAIMKGESINIYNNGEMMRDFTYIDDIIDGISLVVDKPAKTNICWDPFMPDPATSSCPYRLYNIGNSSPVLLSDLIAAIENATGLVAQKNFLPMQLGDTVATYARMDDQGDDFNFQPKTDIKTGIDSFVSWYMQYFKIKIYA